MKITKVTSWNPPRFLSTMKRGEWFYLSRCDGEIPTLYISLGRNGVLFEAVDVETGERAQFTQDTQVGEVRVHEIIIEDLTR